MIKKKRPTKKKKRLVVGDEVRLLREQIHSLGETIIALHGEIQEWKAKPAKPVHSFEGLAPDINRDISRMIGDIESNLSKVEGDGTDGKLCNYLNADFPQIGASQIDIDQIIEGAVARARKKYAVREDRTAEIVDYGMADLYKLELEKNYRKSEDG